MVIGSFGMTRVRAIGVAPFKCKSITCLYVILTCLFMELDLLLHTWKGIHESLLL